MAEIGKDIGKAKHLLEQGELVAIPTETVYGLAGNALSASAVAKIFKAKERPQFDPLIVHVPNFESIEKYAIEVPPLAKKLTDTFWPGPLTILLKKKSIIPDLVTAGLDTVGLRCPDHALTRELLQSLSFPLAAPSANPFGYISPTRPEHVNEQLGDKIAYILDGGACPVGVESTIVGFENSHVIIHRMGGASIEAIESIVGRTSQELNSSSNPKAPGQLKSHYAPRKKVILGNINELIKAYRPAEAGVIVFDKVIGSIPFENQIVLSPSGTTDEAAQNLFAALRELDKKNVNIILAELVPDQGLGKAVNDRLRRAAAE